MSCKRCIRNSRILHRRAHACNRTTSLLIICTIDKTTRFATLLLLLLLLLLSRLHRWLPVDCLRHRDCHCHVAASQ